MADNRKKTSMSQVLADIKPLGIRRCMEILFSFCTG